MYNNAILPMQDGKSALDVARQKHKVEAVKILEAASKVSEDLYACIYMYGMNSIHLIHVYVNISPTHPSLPSSLYPFSQ